MNVAVGIDHPCVACVEPLPAKALEVAAVEALFVFPEHAEGGGREGQGQHDVAHLAAGQLLAFVVDHSLCVV
jgi:hypothetical protein